LGLCSLDDNIRWVVETALWAGGAFGTLDGTFVREFPGDQEVIAEAADFQVRDREGVGHVGEAGAADGAGGGAATDDLGRQEEGEAVDGGGVEEGGSDLSAAFDEEEH